MPEVLARVVNRTLEGPRGPDVTHRVSVRRVWLAEGRLLQVALPRHLACAACGGGGCDRCERSGAITLRGRAEPAELLSVRLPELPAADVEASRPLTLRIPDQGGLPALGSELPRGVLLLTVLPGEEADGSVKVLDGARSERPARISLRNARELLASLRPSELGGRRWLLVVGVAFAVSALVTWLVRR